MNGVFSRRSIFLFFFLWSTFVAAQDFVDEAKSFEVSELLPLVMQNYSALDIFEEEKEYSCGGTETSSGFVARSFPLKPLLLVPLLIIGFKGIMASGLLIHLVNFFLLAFIFKRKNIDLRFLVLYLFFPTFVWSFRTLFTELWVLAFFLLAYIFYETKNEKSLFVAGLMFGFAFLTRYDAALGFIAFAIPLASYKKHFRLNKLFNINVNYNDGFSFVFSFKV